MSWAFITAMKKNPQQSYVQLLNSIRDELATKSGMLGVNGVGNRRSETILARNFSGKTGKSRKKEKGARKEGRDTVCKQPSSTAEIR